MTRPVRIVDQREWRLSDAINDRRARLLDVPSPAELLADVITQAGDALQARQVYFEWQESNMLPGYFRLLAQVPLSERTFDQFFNGRSGLRAQYYLSPEEGILFNRDVVFGLEPALQEAGLDHGANVTPELVQRSLRAPHSKIWIFQDVAAFAEAIENALTPPRWEQHRHNRGCRAPLPIHRRIDIKGAFINPETNELFIDEYKLRRAEQIFECGFT